MQASLWRHFCSSPGSEITTLSHLWAKISSAQQGGGGGCPQQVLSSDAAGLKIEFASPGMEWGGQSDCSTPSYTQLMTNASRWESNSSQLAGTDKSTFKPNHSSEGSAQPSQARSVPLSENIHLDRKQAERLGLGVLTLNASLQRLLLFSC